GSAVHAGSVNGAGVLQLHVDKAGDETLVSEIIRLMEAAEGAKSKMVDLADKVARAYAPVVHIAALATFVGWLLLGPGGWEPALRNAVAVLIITCPCALALAVPAVQVIASGALMRRGILLKSATALERVGKVDTVVFDKTGTLTVGRPVLVEPDRYDGQDLRQSAALAANSRHPLARALVEAVGEVVPAPDVIEQPGLGLEQGDTRLGSAEWNGIKVSERVSDSRMELWMTRPGKAPVRFSFIDTPRDDAASTIAALHRGGMETRLLSGDRPVVAETIAKALGIIRWRGGQRPDEKVAEIAGLESDGRCVMMIGDGLNDAAALTSASVSMSPSSAAEISQNAADVVFQGDRLAPVLYILDIAKRVDRLTKQNFALAIGYNVITIPLAMAGMITPLIAALAMSSSSILVVLNALRLGRWKPAGETR
ncbi:MAG: heavy metal translocating P-type ATPase, partial [Pseudomonadota bacterium]